MCLVTFKFNPTPSHKERARMQQVEPSEVLSTLLQWNSPKPSMVMVKIFANSPYLPQGSFGSPYLDVTILSTGTLTAQFPLVQLCVCRLLFFCPLKSSCHMRRMTWSWKSIHSSGKHCGKALRRTTACQILCCCQFLPLPSLLIAKRAHRPKGT